MSNDPTSSIAIVGMGPRGLGALEALALQPRRDGGQLGVDVFDPFPAPGAGPNFDPEESPVCRLNIPMRDIDIPAPAIMNCGRFADWLTDAPGPDTFPGRADLGRYLEARYAALRRLDTLAVRHLPKKVERVRRTDDGWILHSESGLHGPYDEVLLALGQPRTRPDKQLAEWQTHARTRGATLAQAYPARRSQADAAGWTGRTIAIRGLALSAFDVLRVLSIAQGGCFQDGRYRPSGREPARILPFSLDGMPPFPKPATEALDARFVPTRAESDAFAASIAQASDASEVQARTLINAALRPAVSRILRACGTDGDEKRVAGWLDAEWEAPGTQEAGGTRETLRAGIDLATGKRAPSIGYTVGQVWRKWQDLLRSGYNPARTPPETAEILVGFDEGLKRYSYGPPVSSSYELAALIDADIVDLDFAADPEVSLTDTGWELCTSAGTAEASVMIDAVLPTPDLEAVEAPLVECLLAEGWITPLCDGLAANTAEDGQLIDRAGDTVPGLCLLGRLALGSVIAADSLHDCFGDASRRWARSASRRIG